MLRFKKGELFPLPKQSSEGVIFSVETYTMLLIYYFRRPSAEEIAEFKTGEVSFAMTELRNTLFVLSRFGRLSWMDTPYSTQLSDTVKSFPVLAEGQGYSIDAFLVDLDSNLLVDHRLLRLDTDASRKLVGIMEADLKKTDFSPQSYENAVNEVYRNYSTRDLLGYSSFRTKLKSNS